MIQKNAVPFPFGLLLLSFMILIGACTPQVKLKPDVTKPPVMIGYCPTMRPYVELLLQSHDALIIIQYDSAAQVMQALNSGIIHGAIIGRVAREDEINEGISLIRLADGYTLIASDQSIIRYEDLQKIPILTTAEKKDVDKLLPEVTDITYYQDFDNMLSEMGRSEAVFLRWSEVSPIQNLLIPVDRQGLKVALFRSPHFYYWQDSGVDLSSILEALAELS